MYVPALLGQVRSSQRANGPAPDDDHSSSHLLDLPLGKFRTSLIDGMCERSSAPRAAASRRSWSSTAERCETSDGSCGSKSCLRKVHLPKQSTVAMPRAVQRSSRMIAMWPARCHLLGI